jgi:flagellar motor switch protein FliM
MATSEINVEMNIDAEDQRAMFDKSKIIARRRMPTLELIHERFSRAVRLTLFNMIRAPIEVQMHLPVVKSYQKFVDEFPERTNINIVGIRPLRGVGCWIVDPGVVYIAIDNMFGGEGRLAPRLNLREYTATELRIIRRLVDAFLSEYEKAWKSVYEIKFDFMRQETNFGFAKITSPGEMVLHSKFTIEINGRPGDIDLCIPFWVLEPVKSILYNNMQGFATEPDQHWTDLLNDQVHEAPVTAVAVLARKQMLLREITSLSVGDIIPIEINDPVTVYVDGLPVIKGQYGTKDGRYSVKVSTIQHPAEFLKSPLESARLGPSMMRSAEKGELYEQLPETASSQADLTPNVSTGDTIGAIADGLVPDSQ